tara:strand:+ start:42 stop:467 length:426 start_codon:yes stop_codon:yes gene_type:complete
MVEKNKGKVGELAKKIENNDTLITYGEEALTMRKDDPRTQEFKDRIEKENVEKRKKMIVNDEISLFKGINLSSQRDEGESYEEYKNRLKVNKDLIKIYKMLGREETKLQYPEGFKQALIKAMEKEKPEIKFKKGQVIGNKN